LPWRAAANLIASRFFTDLEEVRANQSPRAMRFNVRKGLVRRHDAEE
jgi:hypothetical protein